MRAPLLVATLLAPALLVALAPHAAATVCRTFTVEEGSVSLSLRYNAPGPPGPYTCLMTLTVCIEGRCATVPGDLLP